MTFVYTRLALERLEPGGVLRVRLRGEEPRRNVPLSAAEQGYAVLSVQDQPDGTTVVELQRP